MSIIQAVCLNHPILDHPHDNLDISVFALGVVFGFQVVSEYTGKGLVKECYKPTTHIFYQFKGGVRSFPVDEFD
jgi:hypothetical protein